MTDKKDSAVLQLPKGSMIGLVGGGQLGMFFTQAAQRLGYQVCCFCNREDEPAARFADKVICGPFDNKASIDSLVSQCNVVTYEFESIPAQTLAEIDQQAQLMPSLDVVQTTQDRSLEKCFLKKHAIPTSEFAIVESADDLARGMKELGGAVVLKTARDGYDGKGQWKLRGDESESELATVLEEVAGRKCTLERLINLRKEVSVIVAGDQHGNIQTIGPIQNHHVNHILDTSWIDHTADESLHARARELAIQVANHFGLVGTLCVEFFVSTDGQVLVNEIAPRPHNSGHLTIDAFSVSQFDVQALAVAGLEISEPVETKPAAMVNLLGDLWLDDEPAFDDAAAELDCEVQLHLYGKSEARAGRKMGHATLIAETQEQAIQCAERYRSLLHRPQTANHNS